MGVEATETTRPATLPGREMEATRKHIRGSTLLLLGRLISLGLNFVVQVLTVRYLTKNDYGAFAYALSAVSLAASVCLFGLDKAIARNVPIYEEEKDYRRMFGTILLAFGSVLGIGLSLILLAFALRDLLLASVVRDPRSLALLLIVIALAPAQALDSLFQGLLAALASPRAIFFRRHLLGPGLKLAAVVLVLLIQGNVYLLATGYLIGGLMGVALYVLLLVQVLRKRGLWRHLRLGRLQWPVREVFGFSIPLLTTDVVLILKSSGVVLLLEYFKGPRDVAEFRAVVPVAGLNMIVMQGFKFLYTPLAARLFARQDTAGINDLYWRTTIWIAVFSFPVFLISFALAEPLTVLLFGERYAGSGLILAVLAVGEYFNAAFGFNSYTLRVYGKVGAIVAIDILSVIVALALSLWLIPRYGALGAAIGTTVTLVAYNVLNHTGLLLGTGVELFQRPYLGVYLRLVVAAALVAAVQLWLEPPLVASVVLVGVVSLLVLRSSRRAMDVANVFPELRRVRLLRPLLGI